MELLLLTVYLLLQVGDWWTTTKVLSQGGTEANPIVAKAMNLLGTTEALVLVKGLGAIAGVIIWYYDQTVMLTALTALYAYVVVDNYGQIQK